MADKPGLIIKKDVLDSRLCALQQTWWSHAAHHIGLQPAAPQQLVVTNRLHGSRIPLARNIDKDRRRRNTSLDSFNTKRFRQRFTQRATMATNNTNMQQRKLLLRDRFRTMTPMIIFVAVYVLFLFTELTPHLFIFEILRITEYLLG